MIRPADIPEDIFDAAQRASITWLITERDGIYRPPLTEAFARAILAERQRCAAVVMNFPHFIALSEEDVNFAGVVTRRTSRADLAAAIKGA